MVTFLSTPLVVLYCPCKIDPTETRSPFDVPTPDTVTSPAHTGFEHQTGRAQRHESIKANSLTIRPPGFKVTDHTVHEDMGILVEQVRWQYAALSDSSANSESVCDFHIVACMLSFIDLAEQADQVSGEHHHLHYLPHMLITMLICFGIVNKAYLMFECGMLHYLHFSIIILMMTLCFPVLLPQQALLAPLE